MDEVNFFMEVSETGDYELRYANPNIKVGAEKKWVAVEFKSTILRVGTPWADCSGNDDTLQNARYDVGIIMPVLFGHPNLHSKSLSLREGFADYDAIIADLKDVSVPVKVVLEIYNAQHAIMGNGRRYTDSADDGQCYKAGTDCPENHFVCKPEYCEIDVWRKIIGDFKSASPKVEVLGSINPGTTTTMYTDKFKAACATKSNVACIALDGFYFAQGVSVEAGLGSLTTVSVTGQPLFDASAMNDATVHVTLTDTASKLGVWTPYSWYPSIQPQKWAAIVTDASLTHDTSKDHTIPDDGTASQTNTLDTL